MNHKNLFSEHYETTKKIERDNPTKFDDNETRYKSYSPNIQMLKSRIKCICN